MSHITGEDLVFKVTETGHIDTGYYMSKARVARAQVSSKFVRYARDKFMEAFRYTVRVFTSKSRRRELSDTARQSNDERAHS